MKSQETKNSASSAVLIGEMKIGARSLQIWRARKVILFGATAMEPEEALEAAQLLAIAARDAHFSQ